jgi:hypothetical protein
LLVGAISVCSILFVLPLPKDAGAALTQRPTTTRDAATEAATEAERQI